MSHQQQQQRWNRSSRDNNRPAVGSNTGNGNNLSSAVRNRPMFGGDGGNNGNRPVVGGSNNSGNGMSAFNQQQAPTACPYLQQQYQQPPPSTGLQSGAPAQGIVTSTFVGSPFIISNHHGGGFINTTGGGGSPPQHQRQYQYFNAPAPRGHWQPPPPQFQQPQHQQNFHNNHHHSQPQHQSFAERWNCNSNGSYQRQAAQTGQGGRGGGHQAAVQQQPTPATGTRMMTAEEFANSPWPPQPPVLRFNHPPPHHQQSMASALNSYHQAMAAASSSSSATNNRRNRQNNLAMAPPLPSSLLPPPPPNNTANHSMQQLLDDVVDIADDVDGGDSTAANADDDDSAENSLQHLSEQLQQLEQMTQAMTSMYDQSTPPLSVIMASVWNNNPPPSSMFDVPHQQQQIITANNIVGSSTPIHSAPVAPATGSVHSSVSAAAAAPSVVGNGIAAGQPNNTGTIHGQNQHAGRNGGGSSWLYLGPGHDQPAPGLGLYYRTVQPPIYNQPNPPFGPQNVPDPPEVEVIFSEHLPILVGGPNHGRRVDHHHFFNNNSNNNGVQQNQNNNNNRRNQQNNRGSGGGGASASSSSRTTATNRGRGATGSVRLNGNGNGIGNVFGAAASGGANSSGNGANSRNNNRGGGGRGGGNRGAAANSGYFFNNDPIYNHSQPHRQHSQRTTLLTGTRVQPQQQRQQQMPHMQPPQQNPPHPQHQYAGGDLFSMFQRAMPVPMVPPMNNNNANMPVSNAIWYRQLPQLQVEFAAFPTVTVQPPPPQQQPPPLQQGIHLHQFLADALAAPLPQDDTGGADTGWFGGIDFFGYMRALDDLQLDLDLAPWMPTLSLRHDEIQRIPHGRVTLRHVENETQCTTCLEEFKLGTDVAKLDCQHIFHFACIVPWFQRNNTCPICRRRVNTTNWPAGGPGPVAADDMDVDDDVITLN